MILSTKTNLVPNKVIDGAYSNLLQTKCLWARLPVGPTKSSIMVYSPALSLIHPLTFVIPGLLTSLPLSNESPVLWIDCPVLKGSIRGTTLSNIASVQNKKHFVQDLKKVCSDNEKKIHYTIKDKHPF